MKEFLKEDWFLILKRAWSVRLFALAGIFQAAEIVLPLFVDSMPRWVFSALTLVACIGGIWARVVPQKSLHHGKPV
jgi:hypothetical protein